MTVTTEEYVSFDTEVETTAEMSVSEIVKSMSGTTDPESAEEDDNEITQVPQVLTREAKDALKTLVQYAQQHEQGEKLFSI